MKKKYFRVYIEWKNKPIEYYDFEKLINLYDSLKRMKNYYKDYKIVKIRKEAIKCN